MQRIPMTVKGADALKVELETLKTVDRLKIVEAIADARAHGDLKENAEYHAAREQQGFMEARIRDIESKLSHAQIIDVTTIPNQDQDKVVFGATVELVNLDTEATVTYQIVGDDEADLKHNKISVNSPISRALIGKKEGEEVLVKAPRGDIDYEIVQVHYR